MDKVECKICGRLFGGITHLHLKTHGMSVPDYKELYPDALLQGDNQKKGHFKKGMTLSEEQKMSISKAHKGIPLSEEHRQKISGSSIGKTFSEETKNTWSRQRKGRRLTEEHKKKIGEAVRGFKHTEEAKIKIGRSSKGRLSGNKHPNWGKPARNYYTRERYIRKRDGKSITFRSSWELLVAKYLDDNNIYWEYEMKSYDLGDSHYSPDFFILTKSNNIKELIEVKGWMKDMDKKKINKFRELYPKLKLSIWDKKVLRGKGINVK